MAYRVTLGYRASYMPYYGSGGSIYPGHHGLDLVPSSGRASGHPIKVSGVQIGLMGNTGISSGAHLHVDKSIDGSRRFSSYRSPRDWEGVKGKVTFAAAAGSAGNMVKILAKDGHVYRFLHLKRIDVKVGQEIGGSTMTKQEEAKLRQRVKDLTSERNNWRNYYGSAKKQLSSASESNKRLKAKRQLLREKLESLR